MREAHPGRETRGTGQDSERSQEKREGGERGENERRQQRALELHGTDGL